VKFKSTLLQMRLCLSRVFQLHLLSRSKSQAGSSRHKALFVTIVQVVISGAGRRFFKICLISPSFCPVQDCAIEPHVWISEVLEVELDGLHLLETGHSVCRHSLAERGPLCRHCRQVSSDFLVATFLASLVEIMYSYNNGLCIY
jgi:hypothetical protein